MAVQDSQPRDWTRMNIVAHWTVLVLVIVQFVNHEGMEQWFRALTGGGASTGGDVAMSVVHVVAGVAILAFTAYRAWERVTRGRPPYPAGHPAWMTWASKITHFGLFAVLLAMPPLGLAALVSGSRAIGNLHSLLWTVLLVLVALHVAGAIVEHFVMKTDVVRRMVGRGPKPFGA